MTSRAEQKIEDEAAFERPIAAVDPATLNRLILKSAIEYAILTLDADGLVTSWNEGAERILGWMEEEIVGRSADVFFTPEDIANDRPEIEMRIADEKGRAEDMRWHMRKDGKRFWATGLIMPLDTISEPGRREAPKGYVKIFRDRTSQHETDRRVRDLENRAAFALRSSGAIGVWDYDVAADTVVADAPCAILFGVDPDKARVGAEAEEFFAGVHREDRDRVRDRLRTAVETKGVFDETYRLAVPTRRPRWVQGRGTVHEGGDGRSVSIPGIVIDVTEQRSELAHQSALLALGDRLRDIDDATRIAAVASELLARTLNATRAGHGYLDETGEYIDIAADWTADGMESLTGRLRFPDFGTFTEALRRGETVVMEDARTHAGVADPAPLEDIRIRALLNVPLMERGRLKAVLFVNDSEPRQWTQGELRFVRGMFDRTYAAIERARFQDQRDVMTRELAHRMKNMLSIAQSVATQSLRHAKTLEDGRAMIAGRLSALSRAQDILTVENHAGAPIETVVHDALAAHDPEEGRIRVSGPSLLLQAQQVLGLSLALHELGTNASKYGALSTSAGTVDVFWKVDGDRFSFAWTELGGPKPDAADAGDSGFGSTILNRVTGQYFNGTSEMILAPEGLTFTIQGRLDG